MTLKNVKPELDAAFSAFQAYGDARQLAITEKNSIVKECRESIATVHSANSASSVDRDDLIKDAQEKAEKAGKKLKAFHEQLSDQMKFLQHKSRPYEEDYHRL